MSPILIKMIKDNCKGVQYKKMNSYLKKQYNLSIAEIIDLLEDNIVVNKVKNLFLLTIDTNAIEQKSKIKLETLIRLIDCGNTEIKGINLISDSVNYLKDNVLNIYRIYQMKGV